MKSVCLVIGFILALAGVAVAQGDYVHEAKRLTWDHDHPDQVEEYRLYCDVTTGFVPAPTNLISTIVATDPGRVTEVAEAPIIMGEGHYYCVVTAFSVALGESLPSNEWEGTVINWSAASLRVK